MTSKASLDPCSNVQGPDIHTILKFGNRLPIENSVHLYTGLSLLYNWSVDKNEMNRALGQLCAHIG